MESDGRPVDHLPARGADFHRLPCRVAEVEVNSLVELADANINSPLRGIEMRPRLDHAEHRFQRLRTRRTARRLEEEAREPVVKALGSDRPSLAVAANFEVRVADAIWRVKNFSRLGEVDQEVSLCRVPSSNLAAVLGNRIIKDGDTTACLLELKA